LYNETLFSALFEYLLHAYNLLSSIFKGSLSVFPIHTNCYIMMLLFIGQLVLTVPREILGVSGWVNDIAVYNRDTVFLACSGGLRRYTIKY